MKRREFRIFLVILITLAIFINGCSSGGTSDDTVYEEPVFDDTGSWFTVVDEQKTSTGKYFSVNTMDCFFKDKTSGSFFAGIIGCGSYYTSIELSIRSLIADITFKLLNIWVGGQVGRFNYVSSGMNKVWDMDLHRDFDSPDDDVQCSPGVRVMKSKMYEWNQTDPNRGINYLYSTNDRKTYYSYRLIGGIRLTQKYDTEKLNYSFIDFLEVSFPSRFYDMSSLRALLFFEDGYIGYINGSKLTGISVPSQEGKPVDVAVRWPDSGYPDFVVAYAMESESRGSVYYVHHDGSQWAWTKLRSFPLGDCGIPAEMEVKWADTLEKCQLVLATKITRNGSSAPSVLYKIGLNNEYGWCLYYQGQVEEWGDCYQTTKLAVNFEPDLKALPAVIFFYQRTPLYFFIGANTKCVYTGYSGSTEKWPEIDTSSSDILTLINADAVDISVGKWFASLNNLADNIKPPVFTIFCTYTREKKLKGSVISFFDGSQFQTLYKQNVDGFPNAYVTVMKCQWDETAGKLINLVCGFGDGSVRRLNI